MAASKKPDFGKSFGQKRPSLSEIIQKIVKDYPSGQTFKEIVQNADDARATEVKFYLDTRSLPTLPPKKGRNDLVKGPALLSYNNAPFTEEDWEGIQNLSRSSKATNPHKVGKFGIGFNSVYHFTDLPVILSEEYCGYLEPQERVWKGETGKFYTMEEMMQKYPETLNQFHGFGKYSNGDTHFKGRTLFRFPLRQFASESDTYISKEIYPSLDKVFELLDNFKKEAKFLLLFLRSVSNIEVLIVNNEGDHKLFFKVSIDTNEALTQRAQFVTKVEKKDFFTDEINHNIIQECFNFIVTVNDADITSTSQQEWLVVNQVGSNNSKVLQLAKKQHVLPWVGIAIEINSSQLDNEERIFCVLPLPVEMKAPFCVHINGTFAVSSNRRSLQWEAQERHDEEAKWNKLLVSKCIPACYVRLVSELIRCNKDDIFVYKCWPDINKVMKTPWRPLLKPFYNLLLQHNKVFYTDSLNDWISVNEATFIEPGNVVPSAVKKSVLKCNVNLVELWDNQHDILTKYYSEDYNLLSPSKVRCCLKKNITAYDCMSREEKLDILEFSLSDECCYANLIGLKLLPLVNGDFKEFIKISRSPKALTSITFICTKIVPCSLLPDIKHKLVDLSVERPDLHEALLDICDQDFSMIKELTVTIIPNLLTECNTARWSPNQLKLFWQWLSTNEEVSLSRFKGKQILPVKLPTGDTDIVSLDKHGKVYIPPNSDSPKTLLTGLKKFGVKVVNAREFSYLTHSELCEHITQLQPNDLLQTMAPFSQLNVQVLNDEEILAVQNFFSNISSLEKQALAIFYTLPLFKTLQETNRKSINKMKTHDFSLPIAMKDNYSLYVNIDLIPKLPLIIDMKGNDSKLISKLNSFECIKSMSIIDYLLNVAFPMIKESKLKRSHIISFVKNILANFDNLIRACPQFFEYLQNLPFIEVEPNVSLVAPFKLFDPGNNLLKLIFFGKNKFPEPSFNPFLPVLRQCGLRSSITAEEIIEILTNFQHKLSKHGDSNIITVSHDSDYKRIKAVLKYLSLHTDLLDSQSALFLHIISGNLFFLPVAYDLPKKYPSCLEWKGSKYKLSVASTKCTSLVPLLQDTNSSQLPLIIGSQAVFIENLPEKLASFFHRFQSSQVNLVMAHFQEVIKNVNKISPTILHETSIETYKYLSDNITFCDERIFKGNKIWMENVSKFINSYQIAMKPNPSFSRVSLEPFIFILPTELHKYSKLFLKCGVCKHVTHSQIISVLHSIKDESAILPTSITHEEAWSIVKAILDWVVEDKTRINDKDNILVPVDSSNDWPQLVSLSKVGYTNNDLFLEIAKNSDREYYLIHPKVSYLSSQLGLTPLSDQLNITEDIFDDAGQHESLITRLSNILREYKDGLTIIKEMIQNADDAGATEVNILYDNCNHSTDKLLFKGMADSHGPALIVHNNTTFTDEDFENITKLAGATKANQPLKIGKFGVGFCSVYHITDVPSFVSGEWLYIFDPTLKHLKGIVHNENRPGKKIKYQSQHLVNTKQLVPYEGLFNFSSFSTYNGTMFRLPFRKCTSQISSTIYNDQTISQMKDDLQSNGSQLLLFLQHVKKITFSTRSNYEIVTLFTIKCTYVNDDIKCITNFSNIEHWLVFTYNEKLYDQQSHTKKPATASVACQLISNNTSFQCQLTEGAVFCFLPLAVPNTGLPVHVNANFAVTSNRSGIWTSSTALAFDSREQWNQQLMETVIPIAYCNLLIKLKEMATSSKINAYDFHSLWPLQHNLTMKHPWDSLLQSLYQLISKESLFYSVSTSQWLTLAQSQFLPSSLFNNYISIDILNDAIVKLKLPVVSLPGQILEQLQECCSVNVITEYEFAQQFLSNITLLKDSINTRNKVLFGILSSVGIKLSSINYSTDYTLLNLLKKHPFVPCSPEGINLEFACNLVDPSNFQDMFDPEDGKFPLDTFNSNTLIHSVLVKLGLMSTDIPWNIIVASAKTVKTLFEINKERALKRVTAIIKCIGDIKKCEDFFVNELKNIPFLPVLTKPNGYMLPWKGEGHHLLSPSHVIGVDIKKYSLVVGSQQSIINTYEISKGGCGRITAKVFGILNVLNKPCIDDVLAHFMFVIQHHTLQISSSSSSISLLETMCSNTYKFLDKELKETSLTTNINDKLAEYCNKNFIWTGNYFVSPCDVSSNWKHENGPFLYKVPTILVGCKHLLKCLKVVDSFSLDKLLDTFKEMYISDSLSKLSSNYSNIVDDIISELNLKIIPTDQNTENIMLPNTKYKMFNASELTYNDAPWLQNLSDINFVHSSFNQITALALGVICNRNRHLKKYSSLGRKHFHGLPFGQREELTRRISNILRDYPLDVTFLKELLQNADDAKATKMCVVLDKRQHGTEKVFSEEWQELQGPAVLVWNDKEFSDKDIEGIQSLGLGSKRDDDESIGQFGIGFNVVYHLTDCPSFITRQIMCVFDPHCKYVPEATSECPGGRYDLHDEFWSSFSDLCSPYLQNTTINKLKGLFNKGVLFRFPLRCTQQQLEVSKIISGNSILLTTDKMEKFLRWWVPMIEESLLFLNHITDFNFYIINESGLLIHEECYSVSLSRNDIQKRKSFRQMLVDFKNNAIPQLVIYPLTIASFRNDRDGHVKSSSKWLIQQGIGNTNKPSHKWCLIDKNLPKHGIAAPMNYKVTNFFGKVFCFLPLPVNTYLPVHVNGHFALNSNRRSLWSGDTEDARTKWNNDLLEAISSSYAYLLQDARNYYITSIRYNSEKNFFSAINHYYGIFPELKIKDPYDDGKRIALQKPWFSLARDVYKTIKEFTLLVIATQVSLPGDYFGVNWHTLHNEDPLQQVYFSTLKLKELSPILKKLSMLITVAPSHVYHGFKDLDLFVIKPESVFKFYTDCQQRIIQEVPCHLTDTPFESVSDFKTFIGYLLDKKGEFPESPYDHALLLTADNELRYFSKNDIVLCTKWSRLFPNSHKMFIHPDLIEVNMSPSYFTDSRNVSFSYIGNIFDNNFPLDLKENVASSSLITEAKLKEIWKCISYSSCFESHQKDIVNTWALLPSLNPPMLYRGQSPILPVVTVMYTGDDLNEMEKHTLTNIVPILKELNIPFLKTPPISESMLQYCPSLDENRKILNVIYEAYKSDQDTFYSHISGLTEEQIKQLFEYLKVTTAYDSSLEKVKHLPLFRSIDGQLTSLTSKKVYLWPSDDFCREGYEKWAPFDTIVFLKEHGSWRALCGNDFTNLGKELTHTEIYRKLIFKVFSKLDYKEREQHLIYIRDKLFPGIKIDWNSYRKDEVESFVNKLKSLKLLSPLSDDTILLPISSFADHTVSIFNLFPEKFNFLDVTYRKEEWLEFLQFFGLQTELTSMEYIEFCHLVANGDHEDIPLVSRKLVDYLFSSHSSEIVKDKNALAEISDISFVYVDTDILDTLSWISGPKFVRLAKFSEAVTSENASLIWTVKPVISIPNKGNIIMNKKDLVKQLQITTTPSCEDVLENVLKISCSKWADFKLFEKYPSEEVNKNSKSLVNVMIDNLKHIHEVKPDYLKKLNEVCCIPINAESGWNCVTKPVLVNSFQVVMHLTTTNSLFPYINPLPNELLKISAELSAIGVCSRLGLKHVQYMLEFLHECCPRIHLPNVKNIVINAILALHELLKNSESDGQVLFPLYLPSINDTLVISTNLVYLDMNRYKKHVVETLDFSESNYSQFYIPIASKVDGPFKKLTEKDVYLVLPQIVRPLRLSHVCYEELVIPISCNVLDSKRKLEEHLQNIKSVSQLVACREGLTKINVSYSHWVIFVNTMIDLIQSIELKTVNNLKSMIISNGKSIGTIKVDYLIQKKDDGNYILYTDSAISKIERVLIDELAQSLCIEVSRIIHEDYATSEITEIVKEFIFVQSLPDFQLLLEKHKINDIEIDESLIRKDDSLPEMGKPMSDYWVSYLDKDANYLYQPQEWVGYETSEDHFIWAIVLHPLLDENSSNNPLLKKYVIQISNEEDDQGIEVSILSLYKLVQREFNEELVPSSEQFGTPFVQRNDTSDLKQLKKKINEQLKLLWDLPETERKKALRRLYLQYHPDKADPGYILLHEEAFKFLLEQVKRLENNLPLIDPDKEEEEQFTSSSSYDSNWTGFFNQWNESAQRRQSRRSRGRNRRRKRYENTAGEQESGLGGKREESQESHERQESESEGGRRYQEGERRESTSSHFSFQPRINMQEAKRWIKQGKSDLKAMTSLSRNIEQEISPQIVFMAHQVMEKSLKAGMYALLGLNPIYLTKHYLTSHAIALSSVMPCLSSLTNLVAGMESHYLDSRYPNKHALPDAPVDKYTVEDAVKCFENAESVYNLISSCILS